MVLSLSFRPTPSRRPSSACLLGFVPRPRAREERASGRFAAAGGTAICLLLLSYRAVLSLPLVRCCCSVRLLAACFDCPVPCDLPRLIDCPFLIKAFQRMRCLAVLPVAVSWRLRPHHLAHHLGWRRRLLRLSFSSSYLLCPVPRLALLCCLLGSAALSHLSSLLSSRTICLLAALRPVSRFASRPVSRFARSSRSPLGDAVAALSDRSLVPFGLRSSIAPPFLSVGWERDGTGRGASLAIVCSLCRRCLPWMAYHLRAFPRCGLFCLLACRRLCR